MAREAGRIDGGYRLVCNIAKGGMGRVELVLRQDADFARLYARKRLLPSLIDDEESHAMFRDEARIAGMLRHPNVVGVYDVGEDAEGLYLIMDYVEGVPLSRLIGDARKLDAPIPVQHCVTVLRQVAEGLHAAHGLVDLDGEPLGLVHRDVSPSNILVELNGVVRVADFGIARAVGRRAKTSTGLLKGKVGYMAPELLRFERPDRRADLYSMGVVLYEMVAARRLYVGDDLSDVAKQILEVPPPDLGAERNDVPDALVELCFELLAKQPDLRPQTAREVVERLDGVMQDLWAREEPLSFEAYLRDHVDAGAIDERRRRAQEVRSALLAGAPVPGDEPTVPTQPLAAAEPSRRGRGLGLALGALMLLGAGSVLGFVLSRQDGPEPATEVAEPAAPPPASATPMDDPREPGTPPAQPEPEPASPEDRAEGSGATSSDGAGAATDAEEARPRRRATERRRARRSTGAGPPSTPTTEMDEALRPWGWE